MTSCWRLRDHDEAGIRCQALTALYEQCDPNGNIAGRRSDVTARPVARLSTIYCDTRVFDRLFVSMVAGEHGGLLAEILDRLAGFPKPARLRKKVKFMTYRLLSSARLRHYDFLTSVVPIFGEISRTS